jgi:hypothetical protein
MGCGSKESAVEEIKRRLNIPPTASLRLYTPAELKVGDVVALQTPSIKRITYDNWRIRLVTSEGLIDLNGGITAHAGDDSPRAYLKLPTGHKTTITVTKHIPASDNDELFTPAELSVGDIVNYRGLSDFKYIRIVTRKGMFDLRGQWQNGVDARGEFSRVYKKLPTGTEINVEVA